jgi:hypothetical protein
MGRYRKDLIGNTALVLTPMIIGDYTNIAIEISSFSKAEYNNITKFIKKSYSANDIWVQKEEPDIIYLDQEDIDCFANNSDIYRFHLKVNRAIITGKIDCVNGVKQYIEKMPSRTHNVFIKKTPLAELKQTCKRQNAHIILSANADDDAGPFLVSTSSNDLYTVLLLKG